jgi:flavin-dependent dehydrogenase
LSDCYDVLIAGAGPAGAALALLLARAGARVALADHPRQERQRQGETASPEVRSALARLGLASLLEDANHREAPAMVSVWGDEQPRERHNLLSPHGSAVHLDRAVFDAALKRAAAQAGAVVRPAGSARFVPCGTGGYLVHVESSETLRARFVVLAVGRSAGGAGLPYHRVALDDHVSTAAIFERSVADGRMAVEAIAGGWFYLAALPAGRTIVVFLSRASAVPRRHDTRKRWWLEALARTRYVRKVLTGARLPAQLSVRDARSSFARVPAGVDWIAVGDARLAPDPLSGSGVLWALEDAAATAREILSADRAGLATRVAARTRRDVDAYRAAAASIYSAETRFDGDPYWDSRRALWARSLPP